MNEKNLVKEEFIGLHVKILDCTDPTWKGQIGLIVDETKNTFLIKTNHGNKKIAKKAAIFEFEYDDEKIIIDGKRIAYRPEERIKKVR
jgi:ribonuclease P protein subunit POP4